MFQHSGSSRASYKVSADARAVDDVLPSHLSKEVLRSTKEFVGSTDRPVVSTEPNESSTIGPETKIISKPPAILANSIRNGRKVVVLASTNAAFLDFTYNWLESVRRIGALPYTVIVAEDGAAFDALKNISDVDVLRAGELSSSKKLDWHTREYNLLVNKRPEHILNFLAKGYDVMWTDVDIVWLQNPFPYFEGDDYDLFSHVDLMLTPITHYLCSGFVYYKCNNKTIELMTKWMEALASLKGITPNQQSFKRVISKMVNLKIKTLNVTQFVPGRNYFDKTWRKKHPEYKPVILHNNFIVGHDQKVNRFKQIGMWYI